MTVAVLWHFLEVCAATVYHSLHLIHSAAVALSSYSIHLPKEFVSPHKLYQSSVIFHKRGVHPVLYHYIVLILEYEPQYPLHIIFMSFTLHPKQKSLFLVPQEF